MVLPRDDVGDEQVQEFSFCAAGRAGTFCMAAALSPSEDADGDPTIDVDAETSAGSVRYCGAA